jgi:hypothetical protein
MRTYVKYKMFHSVTSIIYLFIMSFPQKDLVISRVDGREFDIATLIPGAVKKPVPLSVVEPVSYILPDILRNWPYKSIISPHHIAAENEALAWLGKLIPISPAGLKAFREVGIGEQTSQCALTGF